MVGGRLRCLSCFFTYSAVLLLGVCLLDVEASSCQRIIHKKVGDTVELSSCLPTEGVTLAEWKHENTFQDVTKHPQFMGRVDVNRTDFSLTVRKLTLQDSGHFSFVSEVNDTQRKTVTITLHVHEPITKQPDLTLNSTWDDLNKSCTVLLECRSTFDSSVTYNWSVRNQIHKGSRLQYNIRPEDGETTFTCTISNVISEKSTSKTVKCSNSTSESPKIGSDLVFLLAVAGGGCLIMVIILVIAVAVCHCKQEQAGSDSNDLTVYADVTDFAFENGTSTIKPCSLYETIDSRVQPVTPTPGPQTVYDKIQFNRARKTSVSPYQDIS